MDENIIKGKWKEIKGQLKKQWAKLTDDEIREMKGTYKELAGALQKKYGYAKDEAKREIESFIKNKNLK